MENEWVVYRLKMGKVNAMPRERMDRHVKEHPTTWNELVAEVLATGLTEEQAYQLVSLTKET